MAIVKANYTKSRGTIKASVRYIQHRPGRDGERLTRTLFGNNGPMTRDDAYTLIDQAPRGTSFYRVVISPDPTREDTDRDLNLVELTGQTLTALSDTLGKPIQYIGAIHDDHASHRHVHVIMALKSRLTREHFKLLRHQATGLGQLQRLKHDHARGIIREEQAGLLPRHHNQQGRQGTSAAASTSLQPARRTGTGGNPGFRCPVCGAKNCIIHDQGSDRGYGL